MFLEPSTLWSKSGQSTDGGKDACKPFLSDIRSIDTLNQVAPAVVASRSLPPDLNLASRNLSDTQPWARAD